MQASRIPVGEAADTTRPVLCWDVFVVPLANLNAKLQQLYRKTQEDNTKKKKTNNTKTIRQNQESHRLRIDFTVEGVQRSLLSKRWLHEQRLWILMHVFRASPLRSATSAAKQSFDAPVVKAAESHDPLWLCETCYVFAIKHLLATLVWRMKVWWEVCVCLRVCRGGVLVAGLWSLFLLWTFPSRRTQETFTAVNAELPMAPDAHLVKGAPFIWNFQILSEYNYCCFAEFH